MFYGILCSLRRGRCHPCLERIHESERHPPLSSFVCFLIDSLAVMKSFTAFRTRYSGASIGNKAVTILLLAIQSFTGIKLSARKHWKWKRIAIQTHLNTANSEFQRLSLAHHSLRPSCRRDSGLRTSEVGVRATKCHRRKLGTGVLGFAKRFNIGCSVSRREERFVSILKT